MSASTIKQLEETLLEDLISQAFADTMPPIEFLAAEGAIVEFPEGCYSPNNYSLFNSIRGVDTPSDNAFLVSILNDSLRMDIDHVHTEPQPASDLSRYLKTKNYNINI